MTIREELIQIQSANEGVCSPFAVVNYARNPETALHSRFEWDDGKAGEKYRLWQARQVISLELTVIPGEKRDVETRLFISLRDNRNSQGGYRSIETVLEDDVLRDKMLSEAFQELKRMRQKYGHLKELAAVFEAVEKAESVARVV
jgi:hypothetical protein